MRAMEYTPVQCRCQPISHWNPVHWCLIHGKRIEPTKHLTDAECAAEYWRAALMYAHERQPKPLHETRGASRADRGRVNALYRFATHPHASEVEQAW